MDFEFLLKTDPDSRIVFQAPDFLTGTSNVTLKLTNKSDSRQSFKVKTTRNDLFKIRPPIGILEYNETAEVVITYRPLGDGLEPDSDKSHVGVYHIPCPQIATCDAVWAEHYGPAQGEKRLRISFEKTSTVSTQSPKVESKD